LLIIKITSLKAFLCELFNMLKKIMKHKLGVNGKDSKSDYETIIKKEKKNVMIKFVQILIQTLSESKFLYP
jgi:hypothetical protein